MLEMTPQNELASHCCPATHCRRRDIVKGLEYGGPRTIALVYGLQFIFMNALFSTKYEFYVKPLTQIFFKTSNFKFHLILLALGNIKQFSCGLKGKNSLVGEKS